MHPWSIDSAFWLLLHGCCFLLHVQTAVSADMLYIDPLKCETYYQAADDLPLSVYGYLSAIRIYFAWSICAIALNISSVLLHEHVQGHRWSDARNDIYPRWSSPGETIHASVYGIRRSCPLQQTSQLYGCCIWADSDGSYHVFCLEECLRSSCSPDQRGYTGISRPLHFLWTHR